MKDLKAQILSHIKDKELIFFVSNILDKIEKYQAKDIILYTNFLNLNEVEIAIKILNKLSIKYLVFSANIYMERKIIFLIPSYLSEIDNYNKYVSCVKIVPNVKEKLQHKDYMGSIFSLGIKNEMIGDIVAFDDRAYVFCMNNVSNYLVNNFVQVGKNSVKLEILDIYSPIVLELITTLVVAMYIVSSLRVDIVLSTVFNICRSKIKEKILKGDMCINSKEILNCSEIIKYNDILALKLFGKIKIGNILKKAKNNILEIYKYS